MALTIFRYYYNKMDNAQREELMSRMGIKIATMYRRLNNQDNLTFKEAKIFSAFVFEQFGVRPSFENLTNEIKVEEEEQ